MRIASLGSGSGGNATLIDSGEGMLLIDCGFSIKETEARLEKLNCTAQDIAAILVTHEHSDHLAGVGPLARKFDLPVYLTSGTSKFFRGSDRVHQNLIAAGNQFELLGMQVTPVAVPHDAREPVQYVFDRQGLRLGILTDLGSLTPHIIDMYSGCHVVLVEANHDAQMLESGPYPYPLKKRVGGQWGHLNNYQTATFINAVNSNQIMNTLILGHISKQNNSIELVEQAVAEVVTDISDVYFAVQDSTLDWKSCQVEQEMTH